MKSIVSFALVSSLALASVSAVQPKSAHAFVVGGLENAPALLIVGGSVAALSALVVNLAGDASIPSRHGRGGVLQPTLGLLALGGLLLDDSGTASFGDLTAAQADRAGLTDGERIAYASELPEINAVFQNNQAERMAEFKAMGKVSVENSKADWINESSSLSPEAFSAIQKIATKALSQ